MKIIHAKVAEMDNNNENFRTNIDEPDDIRAYQPRHVMFGNTNLLIREL